MNRIVLRKNIDGLLLCSSCKVYKLPQDFYYNKSRDSFSYYCKECFSNYNKKREKKISPRKTNEDGLLICSSCKEYKLPQDYYFNQSRNTYSHYCKPCNSKYYKEKYQLNNTFRKKVKDKMRLNQKEKRKISRQARKFFNMFYKIFFKPQRHSCFDCSGLFYCYHEEKPQVNLRLKLGKHCNHFILYWNIIKNQVLVGIKVGSGHFGK